MNKTETQRVRLC